MIHDKPCILIEGKLDFIIDEEIYLFFLFPDKLNTIFLNDELVLFPHVRLELFISVPIFEIVRTLQPAFGQLFEDGFEGIVFIHFKGVFPIVHVFYCVFQGIFHLCVEFPH